MERINNLMKKFIYSHTRLFLLLFSILSFTGVSSFWWLSYISIIFFIWNFLNENKYFSICIVFFSIAILSNIFNYTVLRPLEQYGDNLQAEWNQTGYDEKYKNASQESLNIIARSIEEYKIKYGFYPNDIADIHDIFINNHDYSYRIKEEDGQINGVPFYYEKLDSNKYFIAGLGPDGVIKTKDDLIPEISLDQKKTTGLLKYIVKSFSSKELEREKGVWNMDKKINELQKSEESKH